MSWIDSLIQFRVLQWHIVLFREIGYTFCSFDVVPCSEGYVEEGILLVLCALRKLRVEDVGAPRAMREHLKLGGSVVVPLFLGQWKICLASTL